MELCKRSCEAEIFSLRVGPGDIGAIDTRTLRGSDARLWQYRHNGWRGNDIEVRDTIITNLMIIVLYFPRKLH